MSVTKGLKEQYLDNASGDVEAVKIRVLEMAADEFAATKYETIEFYGLLLGGMRDENPKVRATAVSASFQSALAMQGRFSSVDHDFADMLRMEAVHGKFADVRAMIVGTASQLDNGSKLRQRFADILPAHTRESQPAAKADAKMG